MKNLDKDDVFLGAVIAIGAVATVVFMIPVFEVWTEGKSGFDYFFVCAALTALTLIAIPAVIYVLVMLIGMTRIFHDR